MLITEYRLSVREYIGAGELLLKTGDLSEEERQLVQDMLKRISTQLLAGHHLSESEA